MSMADEDFAWHMSFGDEGMESQDYPDEFDDEDDFEEDENDYYTD